MWVKNSRGDFVNIADAKTGEVVNKPRVGRLVELRDERGNTLATVREDALDPPAVLIGGAVPAAFIASNGEITWRPIVGWRVRSDGSAERVLHGDQPDGSMFIAMHDGAMIGTAQFAELYPNLRAACDAVRAAATDQEEAA